LNWKTLDWGFVCLIESGFLEITFQISCVCLSLEKLVNGKHFLVKEKFGLVSRKVFSFYFGRKTLPKVLKNLEMLYYIICWLYQIWSSYFWLLYIYILFWIFVFQFHPLEFDFYINFGLHFYNCYLFFPYYFLIEIFYLSNLIFIILIVTYFIWNNLWNDNYYYFNFFIFQVFFVRFDLYYFDYYLFYLR